MPRSWRRCPGWSGILLVLLLLLAGFSTYVHLSNSSSINSTPYTSSDNQVQAAIVVSESLNQDDSKPYAPTNLVVIPGPNYVDISWDPPSYTADIVSYYIYRNNPFNDEAQPDIIVSGNTYSCRDYDVVVGTRYWYSVRSADSDGPGYWGETE